MRLRTDESLRDAYRSLVVKMIAHYEDVAKMVGGPAEDSHLCDIKKWKQQLQGIDAELTPE
jgi:hypothetical protein